jgi:hypothetical protein
VRAWISGERRMISWVFKDTAVPELRTGSVMVMFHHCEVGRSTNGELKDQLALAMSYHTDCFSMTPLSAGSFDTN